MAVRKASRPRARIQPDISVSVSKHDQDVANWPNIFRELVRNTDPQSLPKIIKDRFGVELEREVVSKLQRRKFNARSLTRYVFWKKFPKRPLPSYF